MWTSNDISGRRTLWDRHPFKVHIFHWRKNTWAGVLVWCVVSRKVITLLCSIAYPYFDLAPLNRFFRCESSLRFCYGFNSFSLQLCAKMADNCTWCPNHTLVPAALCSISAPLCHARTRNDWSASYGCTYSSELHPLSHIIKLVLLSTAFF